VLPANLSADAFAFVFRGDTVLVSCDEATGPAPRAFAMGGLPRAGVPWACPLGALERWTA
jgi:hypothetical protein